MLLSYQAPEKLFFHLKYTVQHRLNMEVDLQSLFRLHVT
jgi:hypothetical protein